MGTATYLTCDHCGAKGLSSGVGSDNVGAVSIDFELPLASKVKEYLGGDLCIDCQTELFKFIKGFGL